MNERIYVQTNNEVCWAAATRDYRFVYVTNFGDSTISSYAVGEGGSLELLEPVAASTRLGQPGVRDEAISRDGRFLLRDRCRCAAHLRLGGRRRRRAHARRRVRRRARESGGAGRELRESQRG